LKTKKQQSKIIEKQNSTNRKSKIENLRMLGSGSSGLGLKEFKLFVAGTKKRSRNRPRLPVPSFERLLVLYKPDAAPGVKT